MLVNKSMNVPVGGSPSDAPPGQKLKVWRVCSLVDLCFLLIEFRALSDRDLRFAPGRLVVKWEAAGMKIRTSLPGA